MVLLKGKKVSAPKLTQDQLVGVSDAGPSSATALPRPVGVASGLPESVGPALLEESVEGRHDSDEDEESSETVRARVEVLREHRDRLKAKHEMQQLNAEIARLERLNQNRAESGSTDPLAGDDYEGDEDNTPLQAGPSTKRRRRLTPVRDTHIDSLPAQSRVQLEDYQEGLKAEAAIKMKDPAMYEGKTLKEHTDWCYSCTQVFRLKPITYKLEHRRVLWAATFLKGRPLENWKRYEKNKGADSTSWEEFEELLLNWVQTAANRSLTAGEKYQKAEQRAG